MGYERSSQAQIPSSSFPAFSSPCPHHTRAGVVFMLVLVLVFVCNHIAQ